MASPAIIDIENLLEPVSEDNAAGIDVRTEKGQLSDYAKIRDARKAARAAERNAVFPDKSNQDTNWQLEADDNWRIVREIAPHIIKDKSKDLEIACWYTESLLRSKGFTGLRDGFKLISGLIENYWDDLHPMPDEDGMETRVAALTGLNGEGSEGALISPLRSISITETMDPGPFSFWKYKQALDAERLTEDQGREDVISKIGFSLMDIQKTVANSSQEFYVDLYDDVCDALDEFKVINQHLIDRCGNIESPPTSNIINTLTEIQGAIAHLAKDKFPISHSDEEGDMDAGETGTSSGSSIISGPIKSRDDAFRQLAEISQFFRRTEPHSPIAYIIEKAVNWGNMSLGELMKELIPDSSSREHYSELTGVRTGDEYD